MQRILVVEDDFDIQELLQNFLQEAGYEVAVANDGVEAPSLTYNNSSILYPAYHKWNAALAFMK